MTYNEAAKLNPNIIMLGEGWSTFHGDEGDARQAADQSWMQHTNSVGVFSDEMRNELKSGYGSEGHPRFLTGGARDIYMIYDNIIAKPRNFTADAPGDVIQYIAAHDNLTLYDVIAQSIKKDPATHDAEIHRRVRLGNLMILTSQGTPFIHSGQEYGRTKQFIHSEFEGKVAKEKEPYKSTYMTDENGNPFRHPYFIHDSYDSSDAINRFDWQKVTNAAMYPNNTRTQAYTEGLIHLRRSTDAFRRGTTEEIRENVSLITTPNSEVRLHDLVIGYQAIASNGDIYAVFINADSQARHLTFPTEYQHLSKAQIIVDGATAGTVAIANPSGVQLTQAGIQLDPLTATVLLVKKSIPATAVTPIPTVSVEPIVIRQNAQVNYEEALTLPTGATLQVVTPVDTTTAGEQTAKVKVIFANGSSRVVTVPVTVKEVRKATPIGTIPPASPVTALTVKQHGEVNYNQALTLPTGATLQVVIPADTTTAGEQTAKVKVTFANGSSRVVTVPVIVEKAIPSDYELVHPETNVHIKFSGLEPIKVEHLKVDKVQPHTATQQAALKDKDALLLDIEAQDTNKQDIDIAYPATVRVPIEANKKVAQVLFILENAPAEAIPFTMVNAQLVEFVAQHFSLYAIVFATVDNTDIPQPNDTDPTPNDAQPKTPQPNTNDATQNNASPNTKPQMDTKPATSPKPGDSTPPMADTNVIPQPKAPQTDNATSNTEEQHKPTSEARHSDAQATLPATGESNTLFSVAVLTILAGLGLATSGKKEETE